MTPAQDLVLVVWEDAHAGGYWDRMEAMEESLRPSIIFTAGHLVYQDDERLVVAASLSTNPRDGDMYAESIAIPASCVKAVHPLSVRRAAKP